MTRTWTLLEYVWFLAGDFTALLKQVRKGREKSICHCLSKVGHHLLFADCQTKWGLDAGRGLLSEKRNQESVNIRQRPET